MNPDAKLARTNRWRPRLGLTLLGLWLLFTYVPLALPLHLGPIYSRVQGEEWMVRNPDLRKSDGLRWAFASGTPEVHQASPPSESGPEFQASYPCQRIWVVCRTPGACLEELGSYLVQELLDRPNSAEVALFSYRQMPINEYRSPDLYITLDSLEERSLTLPGYFQASGLVEVRVQPALLTRPVEPGDAPASVRQTAYSLRRIGWISAAERWRPIGEAVGRALQIPNLLDRWEGTDPPLPLLQHHWMHGAIAFKEPRALTHRLSVVQTMTHGPGWLVHDQSGWFLKGHRDLQALAETLRGELEQEGWTTLAGTPGSLRMLRGPNILELRPLHSQKGQATLDLTWTKDDERPLAIYHYHPFSPQECLDFVENCLRKHMSPAEWKSLLKHLDPSQKEGVRKWLETQTDPDPEGYRAMILEHLRG